MRREKTKLYEERLAAFVKRLQQGIPFEERAPLRAERRVTDDPVPFAERKKGAFRPIEPGTQWGREWQSAWFHLTGTVPRAWKGRQVVARMNFGGEALVFDDKGCPVYGLTNGSVFSTMSGKDVHWLFARCRGGERVDLWVEAAANQLFGINRDEDPPRAMPRRHGWYAPKLEYAELCVFDEAAWRFLTDMDLLRCLMLGLPERHPRRTRLLRVLNEAIDRYADDRRNIPACREMIEPLLASPANASDLKVTAVGHAHIDTGWLWPVRESVRKAGRTFASQIALIERYPGYVFGASQPQLYQFVKDYYPALYDKVRKWVSKGRWELQGAMWVEADCNIVSGESMVRQVLHGKNFFRDEFGADVRNLWLPDVFGYSAAMPQILRKAGVDFFLTQKISWSQFNEFPHHTFKWRGIDGSEVITHFPPENTYNSGMYPQQLIAAQTRFRENDTLDEFLCLYGTGDGGGGPKEDRVERALRMRNLEGCPKVAMGRADEFFRRLAAQADKLETWFGELYLELHRGTLTTQARTKRGNRLLEQMLRATEFLCSCLPLAQYPAAELDRIWKTLLLNQFHDILPGSSIRMVYENTEREHAECLSACEALVRRAGAGLFHKAGGALVLVNPLSHAVTTPVRLPKTWNGRGVQDGAGRALPVQTEEDGSVVLAEVPPLGFATLRKSGRAPKAAATRGLVLENALVRYEFARDGALTRAFDKESGREIIPAGEAGNRLSLYEDRPNKWDAWDIDCFYEEQRIECARGLRAAGLPAGPVRQGLRFERAIGRSAVTQNVRLAANSKRLDFETRVEWNECHRMLRVSFPTTVRTSQASFDIQYGYVRRNTHRNDTWDMARFEVAAQRYVDLSDNDYGVALLNDCKYGHKVLDHVLDLNLLRSTTHPDPDADLGSHVFTYSLLPHKGPLIGSDVLREAALLNLPPLVLDGLDAGDVRPPVALDSDGISLEVLKKAEKEDGLVIRLVETQGRVSTGILRIADLTARLIETDLMEWADGPSVPCSRPIPVVMKPFEIRTYKVR